MLILMPIFGINQGAQPIIGYNYGVQKFDRVKHTVKLAMAAATCIVCIGFILVMLIPQQLIALFNREDLELIRLGAHALQVFLILLPVIGFQIVGANYFQAVRKPKHAMFLSLSRQVIVLIPAVLILPRFFQFDGILMAGPVSDLVSSVLTGIFVYKEFNSLDKKQLQRYELQMQAE